MNNTAVPASPAAVWQTLLAYLLQQHYGLTLNDTEFSDERVIEACLSRGMSLCEALNTFAEKYALVRTDRRNNGITATDILRARKATGLKTHHSSYATRRPVTV
ncbi:TA system toxin CbtA family protein [Morganella morganii]|uniref:TA system toxin CbtA family protein n=1 Tax=Morganella morganii TaxID=582 RepID=UPI001891E9C6|nr:TA system toxin CbtA family protein [Morganella morganii]HDU8496048.1 toxin [Morganella morganii]